MEIEQVSKKELIRVQQIAHLTWPDTFKEILSSEQLQYMLNWMYNLEMLSKQLDEGHQFFILKKEGLDLGFIGIQPNYPSEVESKLHKIYILPSAQGMGAGKMLMLKAEEVAKNNNSEFLVLNVNRFNKATDFYTKIGFEIAYEEDIDIGNGYLMEDFVMKKKL